ncbi:MAG TPA: hypothetical protein DDW36_04290 [Candidatus Magasanikbacteria bacterium]|nr:hypothetical protein [Candidatus Magasanikbacteria bacterium]
MIISLARVITFGLQNFWRNIGLSLTTITVLVLTLLSVNILFVVNITTNRAVSAVNDQVDVSIYFRPDVQLDEAREVEAFVKSFSDVVETTLKAPDVVLAEFIKQHEREPAVIASIKELDKNPLPAVLVIKSGNPAMYRTIVEALDVPEYKLLIESKTFDNHSLVIDKINVITTRVTYLATGLTGVFGLIAFLIIFNAIRVAIYSQREEISITKLVGASNWFIRGPFLFSGLLYVVLSFGITSVLVYFGLRVLDPYIAVLFDNAFSLQQQFMAHALKLMSIQFGVVLLLVAVSSALAMRRHLRV